MVSYLERVFSKVEDYHYDNNGFIVDWYNMGYGWYDGHGSGCGVFDRVADYDIGSGISSGGSILPDVDESDSWLIEYLES